MDEEDLTRELRGLLAPWFDAATVSEVQRRELIGLFRNCGLAFLDVLVHLDEPSLAAYRLRRAARVCHCFARLAEQIGAEHRAEEVRETARNVEALANEVESLRPGKLPFSAWWC